MANKARTKFTVPVVRQNTDPKPIDEFPLSHYSYSTMVRFSTNPIMFKINYINGEQIDTLRNVSGVIGQSFHNAMQAFYSAINEKAADPVKIGLEAGMEYMEAYEEGFIEYSTSVQNKQKALENLSAAFSHYMNDKKLSEEQLVSCEELIEADVDVEYNGQHVVLPVPLKGYIDKIVRDKKGRLKIVDYKTCRSFSDPEKIDGAKILQAIQYYFLVYAQYGEAPYSMTYEEVKISKNRDGGPQVKEYEIVYKDSELFFDFYFRFYDDMTRAINGEAVFVPNVYNFFDNEVSIVAYTHRLDITEEASRLMKELQVKSITELLKKQIESATNIRSLMKNAAKRFVSGKTLNYNDMEIQERIRMKCMEHGMLLSYDSMIPGHTVDLYRFDPGIRLKMSKLKSFISDIEQAVGVAGVRILAPIPNTTFVGFEIPRKERTFPEKMPSPDGFNIAMGVDISNEIFRFDIRKAPHMLVAGATGSGKSVFLNSIIEQLSKIDNVELHLFDPKIIELSHFANMPCTKEYLTEASDIYYALSGLVKEMNDRYKRLSKAGVRTIDDIDGMPYKFVFIDEFGDLSMSTETLNKDVEIPDLSDDKKANKSIPLGEKIVIADAVSNFVLLLAQKARAAGIHLIISTQRPSTDIVTGTIKANFPTKVAFRTAKAIDSQVLLDEPGAEKLLGKGDMLFSSDEGITRLQGFNI